MLKLLLAVGASTLCIGAFGTGLMAQTPSAADAAPAVRDPQTLAALDKMGAALRRLQSFSVRADTTDEKVLTTGQKVQFSGSVEARVKRPNRLRLDRVSDRQARSLYFDGKTVTIYSPRMGFYGSAPASGTIRQVVAAVAEKYNIETPLADLFAWGEDPAVAARIQSAFYVGAQTIDGIACDQYAMREQLVDWQIWIRQKGEALPCKLVITSTDDPSMPQYSAVFHWTPRQTHPASTFTFVPPKGSHKIPLENARPATAAAE
jgi:hypothetical protein